MCDMARILWLMLLFVIVKASHKHHPKFPKPDSEVQLKKVACSPDSEMIRSEIIEQSKCGAPKDVFIYLDAQAAHQQVSPSAVWVKRCVGLCDYDTNGSKCVPIKTRIKHIPIRIFNVKTNKETCSTYPAEEHVSCGCCAGTPDSCKTPRVYDPPEPDYEVESV